jgi:hypothetical protein
MKFLKGSPLGYYRFNAEELSFIDRIFVKPTGKINGFNRKMFDEDFSNIFKYSTRKKFNLFNVVSNDDELIQRLLNNVKLRYNPHRLDEILSEWVEEIALSLISYGVAYYFIDDAPTQPEICISSCSPDSIFHFLAVYMQFVPKRYGSRGDEKLPRELRILDKAKLLQFNMPSSIKRMLFKQNRAMAVIDKHKYNRPDFYPQSTYESPNPRNYFDFSIWQDMQDKAMYRATLETGWNGRKYDSSKRSEFFDCHRLLRFRRNQLILRDNILFQLGNELTRVARQYNSEFHITITPTSVLPKVVELDELEARLSSEEANFTEVIDFCYER